MAIKQIRHAKCDYEIMIFNTGPGVAYDVQFDVHLGDNIGNIGKIYAYEVVKSALYIQTKDRDTLFRFWHSGDDVPSVNPPNIFYPHNDNDSAFSVKKLQTPTLTAMNITIRYKDALGNAYYYNWDGYESQSDAGQYNVNMKYREGKEPLSVIYDRLKNDIIRDESWSKFCNSPDNYNDVPSQYFQWLEKEAKLLESRGYKNLSKKLELINSPHTK